MTAPAQRLLVTGARGFVGQHVEAAVLAGAFGPTEFIAPPQSWELRDPLQVAELVAQVRPTAVLHLAAQSFVPRSFEDPQETFDINLMGTLHLLTALKACSFQGRLVYVSSGDIYGRVPDAAMPVDERRIPEPRSPYAASKVAAEQLCLQWHRSEGLDAVIARPFNHIGPGQDRRFVVPSLAWQIVEIAAGTRDPAIEAGDIDTSRDFTDVRDVVSAYAALFSAGHAGQTYVIASGVERRIRDLLMRMCELSGVAPEVKQDPARLRPSEQRRMVADSARLRSDTGWTPRFSIDMTLRDILEDARTQYDQQ
ncbi:GDP-mannose 4,6-dehydratase [Lysobacter sp. GCM10012299]|uniref:GDP-mannose 4,6-dehydratase n=1 Tax=Lysobacter sp. GCM10012299 TaxID=3317333 RepID=UPI00360B4458